MLAIGWFTSLMQAAEVSDLRGAADAQDRLEHLGVIVKVLRFGKKSAKAKRTKK